MKKGVEDRSCLHLGFCYQAEEGNGDRDDVKFCGSSDRMMFVYLPFMSSRLCLYGYPYFLLIHSADIPSQFLFPLSSLFVNILATHNSTKTTLFKKLERWQPSSDNLFPTMDQKDTESVHFVRLDLSLSPKVCRVSDVDDISWQCLPLMALSQSAARPRYGFVYPRLWIVQPGMQVDSPSVYGA